MSAPIVAVDVPLLVQSVLNLRETWPQRSRRVAKEREIVTKALRDQAGTGSLLPATWPRLLVTLTRRAGKRLDDDNATAGCKAVRDAVAAWLEVDDGSPRVVWVVQQEAHKRYVNTPSVLVEVRAL